MKDKERLTLTVKMKEIDWENIDKVKAWYKENRGLDLKDSSVLKMVLADKVGDIISEKVK